MIEAIEFRNFKVLRECRLPLGPCTVLVGANGSGKSTVLQALEVISQTRKADYRDVVSIGAIGAKEATVEIRLHWGEPFPGVQIVWHAFPDGVPMQGRDDHAGPQKGTLHLEKGIRVYSFDAAAIAAPALVRDKVELDRNGGQLAAVLDGIRDSHPDRFDAINSELASWLPEFRAIHFAKPQEGSKSIVLQTWDGSARIPAQDLSQGTLIALAILTLAHLPEPPPFVAIEEPDRGIHPRLLRRIQDALFRLSHPEGAGEKRAPVQVLATTHSPYFLDLFKDYPEDIVIADRVGDNVRFQRVSDLPDIGEILSGAPLGEVWYSGILGGVPASP